MKFPSGHMPAFKRLAGICDVKIHLIDHLITDGNYSTTLTLAYTEEVRAAGAAMLNTCFFFLVSDYIVADGSLANALDRMRRGTSAVFVGNFQVVRETALPWLKTKLASADGVLALSPRILMAWALRNLHPATIANTVNIPFSHNSHTNRLFWRVDDKTILGRFYLMHMLCVRPEVRDFIIGSSCDYSFVPEMCPSGKVEWITDSDEYFATEMQPHDHEGAFIRLGPLKTRALAASLSEWTTAGHRENANHPLIFHAADVPGNIEKSIAQSKAFIAKVAAHRRYKAPLPHRGHPYWRGAMATFYDATGRRLTDNEWRLALGMPPSRLSERLYWRAKYLLWGRPPYVRPWHPAWPDMRVVFREIGAFFTDLAGASFAAVERADADEHRSCRQRRTRGAAAVHVVCAQFSTIYAVAQEFRSLSSRIERRRIVVCRWVARSNHATDETERANRSLRSQLAIDGAD